MATYMAHSELLGVCRTWTFRAFPAVRVLPIKVCVQRSQAWRGQQNFSLVWDLALKPLLLVTPKVSVLKYYEQRVSKINDFWISNTFWFPHPQTFLRPITGTSYIAKKKKKDSFVTFTSKTHQNNVIQTHSNLERPTFKNTQHKPGQNYLL